MEPKKILIQKQIYDGTGYTNVGDVVDVYQTYHVLCQEMPFMHKPKTKELATRDWKDEDGEDVFISKDGLQFQAYDIDVTFLYDGVEADMSSDLRNFIDYISNCSGSTAGVMLAIYDEYTKIGRRGIYVKDISNDMYFYDDVNPNAIASFKVKFRVTDPVTTLDEHFLVVS